MENIREKLCFVCEKMPVKFCIIDRHQDCYCEDCAVDNFGSVGYLEKMI